MRTLIVGDCHGNLGILRELLTTAGVLGPRGGRRRGWRVVQIGDLCNCVVDSIDGDLECLDAAPELIDVYLVGNHEHPYFGGPPFFGFWRHEQVRRELLRLADAGLIRAAHEVGGVLVSHAGLVASVDIGWEPSTASSWAEQINALWEREPTHEVFSSIGESRGGWNRYGGLLWSDWSEPKYAGVSQIVGHTVGERVRWQRHGETFSLCIDLGGGKSRDRLAGAIVHDSGAVATIAVGQEVPLTGHVWP